MTNFEKALAGLEFMKGGPELRAQRDAAEMLCFQLNQTPPDETQMREAILRKLIPDAKAGCYIKSPFLCEYGSYISLGKNFFANYNCKLIDVKTDGTDYVLVYAFEAVVADTPVSASYAVEEVVYDNVNIFNGS